MKFFDRLLTIVITATVTSMIWIVFGSTLIDAAEDAEPVDTIAQPEETTPSNTVTQSPSESASSPVLSTPALVPPATAPSSSTESPVASSSNDVSKTTPSGSRE